MAFCPSPPSTLPPCGQLWAHPCCCPWLAFLCGLQGRPLYVLAQCSKQPLGDSGALESELHPCPHLLFDPSFSLDWQRQGHIYLHHSALCPADTHHLALSTSGPCCLASATSSTYRCPVDLDASVPTPLQRLGSTRWDHGEQNLSLWERRGRPFPSPEPSPLKEVIPGPYPSLVRAFFCFSPLHSATIPSSPRRWQPDPGYSDCRKLLQSRWTELSQQRQ